MNPFWIEMSVRGRITTIANTVEEMMAPGQAEFTIAGQRYRLEPVIEEDHLFYIVKDLTAGKSTYGAGRFMELPMPKDGVATAVLPDASGRVALPLAGLIDVQAERAVRR